MFELKKIYMKLTLFYLMHLDFISSLNKYVKLIMVEHKQRDHC